MCAQIVGDDLLCTNPKRVQKAIDTKACNALLLKVRAACACVTSSSPAWHVVARSAGLAASCVEPS